MTDTAPKLNPFPAHRIGLWRVRVVPCLRKDRWEEAPFGDRWRALKARLRAPAPVAAGGTQP